MFKTVPFGGGCSLGLAPQELSGGVKSAKWAKVRDINEYLAIVVTCGVGLATSNPVITLEQATNASGGGATPLGIESVHYKAGAPTFSGASDIFTQDTAVTREAPVSSWSATGAEDLSLKECVILVLVRPIDLMDGFTHVRVKVSCAAQKMGAVHYTAIGKAYAGRRNYDVLG